MPINFVSTCRFLAEELPIAAHQLPPGWHIHLPLILESAHPAVLKHPTPCLCYSAYFQFRDYQLSPVEQLKEHHFLNSWPSTVIPVFVPVEHIHWNPPPGVYFGTVLFV